MTANNKDNKDWLPPRVHWIFTQRLFRRPHLSFLQKHTHIDQKMQFRLFFYYNRKKKMTRIRISVCIFFSFYNRFVLFSFSLLVCGGWVSGSGTSCSFNPRLNKVEKKKQHLASLTLFVKALVVMSKFFFSLVILLSCSMPSFVVDVHYYSAFACFFFPPEPVPSFPQRISFSSTQAEHCQRPAH